MSENYPVDHRFFMRKALELAARARGETAPNPMVGCVVVKEGSVVGSGYHMKAGTPHAEIHALDEAGPKAAGATLYVNLEPCCHMGKTPPCTERIIRERVAKVVIGMTDPNPLVAGKGIAILKEAGIEVESGILEKEALELNEIFIKYITTGMPFITIKSAMTMDGKICTRTGDSRWISSPSSRAIVHRERFYHQAIMVGINTVLADDPELTCRRQGMDVHYPYRIILDNRLRIPVDAKILQGPGLDKVIIATTLQADEDRRRLLESRGIKVITAGEEHVDWEIFLKTLARQEISSLLVEGGGNVNASLVMGGFVDRIMLFIAPKIIGGWEARTFIEGPGLGLIEQAKMFSLKSLGQIGDDVLLEYRPREE